MAIVVNLYIDRVDCLEPVMWVFTAASSNFRFFTEVIKPERDRPNLFIGHYGFA